MSEAYRLRQEETERLRKAEAERLAAAQKAAALAAAQKAEEKKEAAPAPITPFTVTPTPTYKPEPVSEAVKAAKTAAQVKAAQVVVTGAERATVRIETPPPPPPPVIPGKITSPAQATENITQLTTNLTKIQENIDLVTNTFNPIIAQVQDMPSGSKVRLTLEGQTDIYKTRDIALKALIQTRDRYLAELEEGQRNVTTAISDLKDWRLEAIKGRTEKEKAQFVEKKRVTATDEAELRRRERVFRGLTSEDIDKIISPEISSGLVTRTDDLGRVTYSLTRPVTTLSASEITHLTAAGFYIPEMKDSLSWKMAKEAETIPITPATMAGLTYDPAYRAQLAAGVATWVDTTIQGVLGLLKPERGWGAGAGVRGDEPLLRVPDVRFLEYTMPNLVGAPGQVTPYQAGYYGVGVGVSALTTHVIGTAVGAATGTTGRLLKNVGKGTSTVLSKAINRLPGGPLALHKLGGIAEVTAAVVGPSVKVAEVAAVGGLPVWMEYEKVKSLKQAGYSPVDIAGHVAVDVAGMVGFASGMSRGLSTGRRIGEKISSQLEYLRKGGTVYDASEVMQGAVLRGEEQFVSFRAEDLEPTAANYIKLAEKYAPADLRMGAGIPSVHGSDKRFDTVFNVKTDINHRGEVGMFFTFAGGDYFLRLDADAAYSLMPGLPRFGSSPQFVYTEFKDVIMTEYSKRAAAGGIRFSHGIAQALDDVLGKGVALMPREQWGEAQTILSPGTRMVEVVTGNFWVSHKGYMIKIGRYLPEITAKELGIPYITGSAMSFDKFATSVLSDSLVAVNPGVYLPIAFPQLTADYPDVRLVVDQVTGMNESQLRDWASSASPSELAIMYAVLTDAQTSISYTVAASLVAPTILYEYPRASEWDMSSNSSTSLKIDYGSYISDSLTDSQTYSTSSPPPDPYAPISSPDTTYEPTTTRTPEKEHPATAPTTLKAEDMIRLRGRLSYFGPSEKYKVRTLFPDHTSETVTIQAKGFVDAVAKSQRNRKSHRRGYLPVQVDVERIG